MKTAKLKVIIAATLITATSSFSIAGVSKVIYGDDNRRDYYSMPEDIKAIADSVVSLWDKTNVSFDPSSNSYILSTQKFGERLNLCDDEPFKDQTIGAFCSGSLVSEDTIITAGHCITNESKCASTYFVFGYAVNDKNNPDTAVTNIPASNVYKCSKILKRNIGPEPTPDNPSGTGLGPDYAIIKLDRRVEGKKPLRMDLNQNLSKGDPVFVIGYPVGLPVKFADGSTIRDPLPVGYFVANLDTYGGNSGSPVFNSNTKLIEGILVRGDNDFIQTPVGCSVSNVVDSDGGRGEDVTKISVLASYFNSIQSNSVRSISVNVEMPEVRRSAANFSFDR
jgi:V8-like Glu-specific endopeptidase